MSDSFIRVNKKYYAQTLLEECKYTYGDNDKYIKTKIKSYGDKINTNFQGKNTPKEDARYKCLSLIMLDSVIRINKKVLSSNTIGRMQIHNKKE